ncbi:hypothetical protein MFIFM68171_10383 [Madurella fahalii]|uniref:Uncharacterized protein n=1 Tax=Madurella fahalii TaxID=1157608 RepID=A0ABQ0GR07_9PEZI
MQLSNILAVFSLAAASAHAALQLTPNHETGVALKEACSALNERTANADLEKRDCKWRGCDDCYERFGYCVQCNNGVAISCITCMAYCEDTCC